MNADWQTLAVLFVVLVAAVLLGLAAWRRRGKHEGCGCPGTGNARELAKLKKRIAGRE